MEGLEPFPSLLSGSFGGAEGVSPTAGVVLRLLPQLPRRTLLGVDLLQTEVPPVGVKPWPKFFFHPLQPDRRIVDIRSEVIEVDIEGYRIIPCALDHADLLRRSRQSPLARQ